MAFAPALRKFTFATHVTTSVGWVGAVLVFLTLAAIGWRSQDEPTVRGAYLVMEPAAWFVLVPLAHGSLFSGIALSLGTTWGLFRHYWVVLKLVLTAFSTVILMIYMGTFRHMAGVAADPVVDLRLVQNPSPMVHASLALVVLLLATMLGVYKPFGMTEYGRRQHSGRQTAPRTQLNARTPIGKSRWVYFAWIVAVGLGVLFIAAHLMGGDH
jgi:hypothetical protein